MTRFYRAATGDHVAALLRTAALDLQPGELLRAEIRCHPVRSPEPFRVSIESPDRDPPRGFHPPLRVSR